MKVNISKRECSVRCRQDQKEERKDEGRKGGRGSQCWGLKQRLGGYWLQERRLNQANIDYQSLANASVGYDLSNIFTLYNKSYKPDMVHIQEQLLLIICFLTLSFFLSPTFSLCPTPQKSIFFSFPALSSREHISSLFTSITSSSFSFQYFEIPGQKYYKFTQFKYQLIYNNHYQVEEYLDQKSVKVRLGTIKVQGIWKYQITDKNNVTEQRGNGRAETYLDPEQFQKMLVEKDGFIQWEIKKINPLHLTALWVYHPVDVQLTPYQHRVISKILNNVLPAPDIRPQIQSQINRFYSSYIQKYLNHEHLISATNFTYQYQGFNMPIAHQVTKVNVSNTTNRGILSQVRFGLMEIEQSQCGMLPEKYSQLTFGAVLQIYTIETVKSIVQEAVHKGLFNLSLNQAWQSNQFQFFMGDLGNAVPYANTFKASQNFHIQCEVKDLSKVLVAVLDEHKMYLQVPQVCYIKVNLDKVIKVELQVIIIARLTAQNEALSVRVVSASAKKIYFQSMNPSFVVERKDVAEMIVESVLNKMKGSETFGTGLPLLYRKYPVVYITQRYLVAFDASEIYDEEQYDTLIQSLKALNTM